MAENLEEIGEEYDLEESTLEEMEDDDSEETNIVTSFMKNFKARGGRL